MPRKGHWSEVARKDPAPEALRARMKQKGGAYDSFLREDVKKYLAKDGPNTIRFLPSDREADHYGIEIFVHYSVGPDNSQYLCNKAMRRGPCPICEELYTDAATNDEQYARDCKPKKRILAYLIDRDDEKEGVKVWAQPWTFDKELTGLREDRETREWLKIDDEKEGYDVNFRKETTGPFPKYVSMAISRHPTPVSRDPKLNDAWIQTAFQDEFTDILVYYDYDHIKDVFHGTSAPTESKTASAEFTRETFSKPDADDFPAEGQRPPERETLSDDAAAAKTAIQEKWMKR